MKRIEEVLSVEAVKAAYRSTGLTPMQSGWLDLGCACAASAVALARGASPDTLRAAEWEPPSFGCQRVAPLLDVDPDELNSFICGFDGTSSRTRRETSAYRHGEAVAAAVFGEAAPADAPQGRDA